ncbi:MAG: thiamine pyrophosphate-binding protein [Gemmatimonadota bacterium]
MRSGAAGITRTLDELGVEHAFGVPGTQNVQLLEHLRRSPLRFVSAASELGAAFMANGYFRASGRPGLLVTIGGPGFTLALTGIAEARHDSAALLWLVVTRRPPEGRRFGLQALDVAGVASPLVKAVHEAEDPENLPGLVRKAHARAVSGEPGPVLVEIDASLLGPGGTKPARTAAAGEGASKRMSSAGTAPRSPLESADLERLIARLRASERVVLYVGQGAADAAGSVRRLSRAWRAPVLASTSGRGVVPEDDDLALMVDRPGADPTAVNELFGEADLILVLGCKLSHNGSHGFQLHLPPEKLVHVDASREVLEANFPAGLAIRARVSDVVAGLLEGGAAEARTGGGWSVDEIAAWGERLALDSEDASAEVGIRGGRPDGIPAFFHLLRELLPREAVLVTDSGRHQMQARHHFPVLAPRGLVAPSDFQSMGFGVPAAVGARLAAPERPVVALVGDGGFAMSGMELRAAVREGLSLTVIVFNDGELGLIRQQQHREWGRSVGTRLGALDCRALAAAAGARHVTLTGDLRDTLEEALAGGSGVTVAELPLGRTTESRLEQGRGLARESMRRALGDRLLSWIRSRRRGEES